MLDIRVADKRVNQGFNGEGKYEKKVWKILILAMFILRHEKTTYQVIGSQESILKFSVDSFFILRAHTYGHPCVTQYYHLGF